MDPVLAQAEALAETLANVPRTVALREAQKRLQASPDDAALQRRYHETAQQLAALEDEGRPIEPELPFGTLSQPRRYRRSSSRDII